MVPLWSLIFNDQKIIFLSYSFLEDYGKSSRIWNRISWHYFGSKLKNICVFHIQSFMFKKIFWTNRKHRIIWTISSTELIPRAFKCLIKTASCDFKCSVEFPLCKAFIHIYNIKKIILFEIVYLKENIENWMRKRTKKCMYKSNCCFISLIYLYKDKN